MAQISDVIEGLTILAKYVDASKHCVSAEHDVIYAGPNEPGDHNDDDSTVSNTLVTGIDAARLLELGWHIDSEVESWARFV